MLPKTVQSAISQADYQLLKDFGVARNAGLKCLEAGSLCNHSLEEFGSPLSAQDRETLALGGAVFGTESEELEVVKKFIDECRKILETSLDQKAVASLFKITPDTVSVMTARQPPELHSFSLKDSQPLYPVWQFCASETIPHLGKFLSHVSPSAHVLSLFRFMLMSNTDLEHPDSGQLLSPRDWLVAGYDPEPVMLMAPEV